MLGICLMLLLSLALTHQGSVDLVNHRGTNGVLHDVSNASDSNSFLSEMVKIFRPIFGKSRTSNDGLKFFAKHDKAVESRLIGFVAEKNIETSVSLPTTRSDVISSTTVDPRVPTEPATTATTASVTSPETVAPTTTTLVPLKQYLLLASPHILVSDDDRKAIILDATSFQEVMVRKEPRIRKSLMSVCNNVLYLINTDSGVIWCTDVANILKNQTISWNICANYTVVRSHTQLGTTATIGTTIYFMTVSGHAYAFDTVKKTVDRLPDFDGDEDSTGVAHVIEVDGVIYGYKGYTLKSFDGWNWTSIAIPEITSENGHRQIEDCALTAIGGHACLVGGTSDKAGGQIFDLVRCYNPKSGTWSTMSSINEARQGAVGIQIKGRGNFIVGGLGWSAKDQKRKVHMSIEFLEETSQRWSVITYNPELFLPQAVSFYE